MANDIEEPLEVKVEGDSISPGEQPEIPPLQDIVDTDSSPENPFSNWPRFQIPTELCANVCATIRPLLFALLLLLFPVITVVMVPPFLAVFVVLRLFQLVGSSKNLEYRLQTKKLLGRAMMMFLIESLMAMLIIYYPIFKYAPRAKHVMIIGLPITKWITIICTLIGIFILNQAIWFSLEFISARLISEKSESKLILSAAISEIIGCLLFLLAEIVVMGSVPTFKHSKIAGIYTHNWIKVSVFLIIGYNIITLLTHALESMLLFLYGFIFAFTKDDESGMTVNKKYVFYIASRIKRCVIFNLSMVMLLVTWVVYFVPRLGETPKDKKNLEVGTWTIVSVLLLSFLWLIKSGILLYWKAHAMYDRLHSKIMGIGELLYFLILLSCTHYQSRENDTEDDLQRATHYCESFCFGTKPKSKAVWVLSVKNDEDEKDLMLNRKSVRAELINYPGSSIYDLQRATQRLLTAQYALAKEGTIGDLNHLQGNDSRVEDEKCREVLRQVVQVEGDTHFDDDLKMLLKLLRHDATTTEEITFKDVKTFMERAQIRCIFLADTLISEKEVVNCLNQVLSWLIIGVTFITWLLLTGLSSTTVFVLIASPALAAAFIFGDTAKSLFQGLIFVYVVHPFDVGDLCIIDEKLLEVKRIGIWSTTFSKVRTLGKQHQVIYPNSVLAQKNVINHKTNFDWDDNIEFLSSPEANITEPLKQKIESYLNDKKEKFTPNFHSVEILEMGDKAKIVVHIKHKFKTTEGWTYFECLKAKEKRRFKLAIHVQKLLKRVESEAKTSDMEDFFTRG